MSHFSLYSVMNLIAKYITVDTECLKDIRLGSRESHHSRNDKRVFSLANVADLLQ